MIFWYKLKEPESIIVKRNFEVNFMINNKSKLRNLKMCYSGGRVGKGVGYWC